MVKHFLLSILILAAISVVSSGCRNEERTSPLDGGKFKQLMKSQLEKGSKDTQTSRQYMVCLHSLSRVVKGIIDYETFNGTPSKSPDAGNAMMKIGPDADETCNYILEGYSDPKSCAGMVQDMIDGTCSPTTFYVNTMPKIPEEQKAANIHPFEVSAMSRGEKNCCICITESKIFPSTFEKCEKNGQCKCGH